MKNTQVTFMMDKEIYTMIKNEAEREDRTVSAQIRCILKNYYKKATRHDEALHENP